MKTQIEQSLFKSIDRKELFEQLSKICKDKGGELLSNSDIHHSRKISLRCSKGHEWEASFHTIKRGSWCRLCGLERSRSLLRDKIETFQKLAVEKGGKCLSTNYENQSTKLEFICNKKHRFTLRGSVAKRGGWCDQCHRSKFLNDVKERNSKIKVDKLNDVLSEKRGVLLSGEYINNRSKFKIKCAEGHIWETTPGLIIKGHWCKKCSSKIVIDKQRGTLEPVIKVIEERGGKFISGEYENRRSVIEVECEKGHRWSVMCQGIIRGNWCRECAGTNKRNIDEMRIIGKNRGGECISKEYVSDYKKLEWKCSEGHLFRTSPNNIKHGKWCPECSSGLYERICRLYFEKIFKKTFLKTRPDWLKNEVTKRNLEIDGYNDELKIGFEHQGSQHYKDDSYYSAEKLIANDINKRKLLAFHGAKIIEIPELTTLTKLKDLKTFLYNEFKLINVKPKVTFKDLHLTEYEIYTYTRTHERKKIEDIIRQKCITKNYQVLNFKYDGETKVDVFCDLGHETILLVREILKDSIYCKICKKIHRSKKYISQAIN